MLLAQSVHSMLRLVREELGMDIVFVPADAAGPVPSIDAHLGVPLRRPDGGLYGTLCCLNTAANETLGARELARLEMTANLLVALLIRAEAD